MKILRIVTLAVWYTIISRNLINGKTGTPKILLKIPRLFNKTHTPMLLTYRSALWEMMLYEALALVKSALACTWTCFLLSVSASYACQRMRTHRACVNETHLLRYEALRAVLLQVQIFRDVSPRRLVNSDRRFEGSLCFRTQSIPRNIPENSNLQKLESNDSFFHEWIF
jgi:hypothetical protein